MILRMPDLIPFLDVTKTHKLIGKIYKLLHDEGRCCHHLEIAYSFQKHSQQKWLSLVDLEASQACQLESSVDFENTI